MSQISTDVFCRCEEPAVFPHQCPCLGIALTSCEAWLVASGRPLMVRGERVEYRREATLRAWGVVIPDADGQRVNLDLRCGWRGEYLETVACHTCNGRVTAPVFECENPQVRAGRCTTLKRAVDDSIAWCRLCAAIDPAGGDLPDR